MLKNLFRPNDDRVPSFVPRALLEALALDHLPQSLQTPQACTELESALQTLQDRHDISLSAEDRVAVRERRDKLQTIGRRHLAVAKLRGVAAALEEDRTRAAEAVKAAVDLEARAAQTSSAAAEKVTQIDERLAKVNAARATAAAARSAAIGAAEDDVRRALAEDDEQAEDAAARRLAQLLAAPQEDPVLQLRADELQRMRDAAAAAAEAVAAQHADALRALRAAEGEVAAVAVDGALNHLGVAAYALLLARDAAMKGGVPNARARFVLTGGPVHVHRSARVWFAPANGGADGSVEVSIGQALEALHALASKPIGNPHELDAQLPSGAHVRRLVEDLA